MAKGKKAKRARQEARRAARTAAVAAPAVEHPPVVKLNIPPPWKVTDAALAMSRRKTGQQSDVIPVIFEMPRHPPHVVPAGTPKHEILANDEQIIEVNAWAGQQAYGGAYANGVMWLGYTELATMAVRTEYRRMAEVVATEATRKWIKLQSASAKGKNKGKDPKAGKIAELAAELTRLDVQGAFRKLIELDGLFGRAHLYLDTGDTDNREELVMPIGNGRSAASVAKFAGRTGFLQAVKPVEPVWCYPAKYNATDPLKPDWYNPQSWFCQGKEIHSTRLLPFVGREVPDLLKPSYSFGGLSLSQMVKPYVDNWLRTRQAVADLIWSFSVRGIQTDLSNLMALDGDAMYKRAAFFANIQTNQGIMLLDKESEEFFNVVTPLGSLDALQSQALEHICSATGIPRIKYTGIQPAGFNASSDGEIRVWLDWVAAFQEKFMTAKLGTVLDFVMLSLWGEVDPDITFDWESLEELDDKEIAERDKMRADTATEYIEAGVLAPIDERARLSDDPEGVYSGIDVDDLPEQLDMFGEEGAMPDLGTGAGQLSATERPPRDDRSRDRSDEGDRGARGERPDRDRSRQDGERSDRAREPQDA